MDENNDEKKATEVVVIEDQNESVERRLALIETVVRRWFKHAPKKSFQESPPLGLYSCVIIVHELFKCITVESIESINWNSRNDISIRHSYH